MIEPEGWLDTSSTTSEVQILQLTAPASYGFAPTTLTVDSLIGIVPEGTTAHQEAAADVTAESRARVNFVAGPIKDCKVQADDAAFFTFTSGTKAGYHLFLIHNGLLYAALLMGSGGVSDQSFSGFKAVLGSWTWSA